MGDKPLKIVDEFGTATIGGVPYGVITFPEFVDDLGKRMVMWVAAQAGEDGITEENLLKVTEEATVLVARFLLDEVPLEFLRAVKMEPKDA